MKSYNSHTFSVVYISNASKIMTIRSQFPRVFSLPKFASLSASLSWKMIKEHEEQ